MKMTGLVSSLKMALSVAGAVTAFGFARAEKLAIGETNSDGEYRPNLSAEKVGDVEPDLKLNSSSNFTLKAGAKWVVYDEDLDILNARTDVRRFEIASTATFIFDNTTKGTTAENIFWNSSGTFIKRGPSTMVAKGKNYRCKGSTYLIQEGVWEQADPYTIGVHEQGMSYVYVADGATLRLNDDSSFSGAEIHAIGKGVNGGGAIVIDDFNIAAISKLVLEGDTLLTANKAGRILSGYTQTAGAAGKINPAELTLNGHTLTIGGTASSLNLYNLVTFGEEGGSVVVSPRAGSFTLSLRTGGAEDSAKYDLSHISSFTLPEGSTVEVGGFIDCAITPDFNFLGDATLTVYPDHSDENGRNLTGAISIADGKTLTVTPYTDTGDKGVWAFNFRGTITGGGNLAFGTTEEQANGSVYLWNTNAYAGTTTVNGQPEFKVYACTVGAIPAGSALSVNGGQLIPTFARTEDGSVTWSGEDLLAFYRKLGSDAIRPRVDFVPDADGVTMTPAQVAAAFPGGVTWGATGAGAGGYTLTGPYTAEAPLDIAWSNGTLRLTGPDTITLGSAQVAPGKQPIDKPSTLMLDGASVVFGEDGLNIGSRRQDATRDSGYARLVVSNSTLSCSVEEVSSDIFNGTLFIGRNAYGTLEVEDGAVISNRLVVGGGGGKDAPTSKGAGRGVVLQRGGRVFTRGTSASVAYTSNVGGTGEGYYELSGGELKTSGYFGIGNYHHGTFLQLGGMATFGPFYLAYANGGNGHYTLLGGTTKCTSTVYLTGGTSGEGFLTVSGPQSHFDCSDASYSRIALNGKNNYPLRTTINVNDEGVLTVSGFYAGQTSTLELPFILNFNGGVLRHAAVYNNPSIFWFSNTKATPKVVVYEKGIVLDSNGTNITTAAAAITAEKTGGIRSIDLAAPVEDCYLPPEVYITSDTGFGASATALIDSRTHTLTNILVTSHGWGYTAENTTVALRYGRGTPISDAAYAVTPTFGDNDVGGFTKRGEGKVTVKNANAWEKWTRIEGGTLLIGEAGAVPNGTALTLSNGATIDFGNFEPLPTFTGLDGTGGTVSNGAIVVTGPMTVSAKAFVAQAPCAITGAVDLSGVTSLTLTDADVLTEEMKELRGVSLISATELVLPDGGLTLEGVPEGWHASVRGNRIRLAPDRGMTLLVR